MELIFYFIFVIWTLSIFHLTGRDFFHPVFLLTFIWLLGFLACDFSGYFYPLTNTSRLLIFSLIFVATLFGLVAKAFIIFPNKISRNLHSFTKNSNVIRRLNLLVIFSIFMCILFISNYATHFANYNSIAEYFYYARVADLNDTPLANTGWFVGQAPALAFVTSLFVVIEILKEKFNISYILVAILLSLTIISLGITGTRSVLVIFLLSLFFLIISIKQPPFKKIATMTFVFFFLYSTTTYFMRASEADKQSLSPLDIIVNNLILYIFGGIKGFELFLENKIVINHVQIASMLGVKLTGSMPFFSLGPDLEGNVFSAFSVYVYYFGWIGAIFVLSIIFTIIGILYELRSKNELLLIISSFATTSVVLMVFHDYFFVFFPYIGRVLIIYYFLYKLKKLNIIKLFINRKIRA